MPYTAQIKTVHTYQSQVDNKTYLDVEVEIKNGEKVEAVRHLGYPLETTQEEIEADVKKVVAAYGQDQVLAEASRKVEAAQRAADKVINNLTGRNIPVVEP